MGSNNVEKKRYWEILSMSKIVPTVTDTKK